MIVNQPRRVAGALALTAALAFAATAPAFAFSSVRPAGVSPGDRAFVTNLLQESRAQIALAQLAERRASSAETSSATERLD